MTGPQHYREAERLLAWLKTHKDLGVEQATEISTRALAHAQLATAAATALAAYPTTVDTDGADIEQAGNEWYWTVIVDNGAPKAGA